LDENYGQFGKGYMISEWKWNKIYWLSNSIWKEI
jgi:hypothetical protein